MYNNFDTNFNSITAKTLRKTAGIILFTIVAFHLILNGISYMLEKGGNKTSLPLDDVSVQAVVYTQEGESRQADSIYQLDAKDGDRVVLTVEPVGREEHIENAALVFSAYHSRVQITCGGELIYNQTEPGEQQQIGHRYYEAALPDDYWSKPIRISLEIGDHATVNSLSDLQIVPVLEANRSFVRGRIRSALLMMVLAVVALFLIILSFVHSIFERELDGIFGLSIFCLCIILWFTGYNGLLIPLTENAEILANIEYITLYFAPIPLALFMATENKHNPQHLIYISVMIAAILWFVICTLLSYGVNDVIYRDFLTIHRILFLIILNIFMFGVFHDQRKKKSMSAGWVLTGLTISFLFGALELIRFIAAGRSPAASRLNRWSFMPASTIALIMTLMLDYGLQFSAKAYAEIEKENLKRLAFIDQLTGAPNRSACYQRVEKIKAGEIKDYVIVFIDINFLKITNDRWGHDKGDELIRTAGELLSKYFIGRDFFGRWGGDEFIAIHFGTLAETEVIMNRISAEMDEINRSHRYDFNMSFAWGYGESTAQHPLDPDQAITVADEAMYVKKKADHAERQN